MFGIQEEDINFIVKMVEKGGPDKDDYQKLDDFFNKLGDLIRKGNIDKKAFYAKLWELFGDAGSLDTMQGRVALKPHGYAGDFEIIDKIYTFWTSSNPHLEKWDHFFHSHSAPKAVRNRKQYFINMFQDIKASTEKPFKVLSVGSGPARDIYELFTENKDLNIYFECVDIDSNAISFAQKLCNDFSDKITFHCKNIFRFRTNNSYDVVWSAGLFDYLEDEQFIYLAKVLYKMVKEDGELAIGNFSDFNPSRDYMEAGDWYLHHRSESKLIELAKASGVDEDKIKIYSEPEKVNLFLHIKK